MHVKCQVNNGQITPFSYTTSPQFANMFNAQFYYSKGEFPFLLEFTYITGNFYIDFKENMGNIFRTQNYRQNIFGGGITIEPLQKAESKFRYGFGIYAYGYQFHPESASQGSRSNAQMLNFFTGLEAGIRLNPYFYLNGYFRIAPFEINYVKSFKGLIPLSYHSSEFKMSQRDKILGVCLGFDFAKWFREKDRSPGILHKKP